MRATWAPRRVVRRRSRARSCRSVATLVLAAVLAACGDDRSPTGRPPAGASGAEEPPNPSGVKAAEPPRTTGRGRFGPYEGVGTMGSPVIEFRKAGAEAVGGTLRTGSVGVLAIAPVERDARLYLLVSEFDAAKHLVLARFHDADGDGLPDASTRRVLLTSGSEPMFVHSIAVRSPEVIYLEDGRCGDIVVAVDGDGDGWVDRLKPRRFARSDEHTDLILCEIHYRYEQATKHHVLYVSHEFGREIEHFTWPYHVLRDVDGDDVADYDDEVVPRDRHPKLARGQLSDGASRIDLLWDSGGGAETIEAWRLDGQGADVERLGAVVVAKDVAAATVVLDKALVAGWRVGLRVRGDKTSERVLDVFPVWPVAQSVEPDRVPAGVAAELTIRGRAFTPTMSVRLVRPGTLEPLEFTLVDATTARVRIPPQRGDFGVTTVGAGQRTDDPENPLHAIDVHVRAP